MKYPLPAGSIELKSITLTDGRTLSYCDNGVASTSALLFHHGTPGNAQIWETFFEAAAAKGVRAISYTKAGYPGSDHASHNRISDTNGDYLELLEQLGVTEFVSIGWSGGGPYALHSTFEGSCKGAELIAAVAPYYEMGAEFLVGTDGSETVEITEKKSSSKEACLEVALADIQSYETFWTVENWQKQVEDRVNYKEFADLYSKFNALVVPSLLNAVFPDATGYATDDYLILNDWGFKLSDVTKPVSIWNGDEDLGVPTGHAIWQHERIKGSTLHILQGQKHVTIMVEAMEPILDSAIAKLHQ
jgi:pimeloyl-ACP methyl ester carboxylesterase